MAANLDFDNVDDSPDEESPQEEQEEAEEQPASRQSPLRLILLALLILVLLCAGCFLATRLFDVPIPGLGGGQPPAAEPTEAPAPTDAAEVPAEETVEPVTATEEVPVEEPVATEEPPVDEQPPPEATEEPAPGVDEEPPSEPTEEVIDEHAEEPVEPDLEEIPTTEPEPGPTVVITPESCEDNVPPIADADADPNPAMLGKGQAFVTFDASASSDSDGTIVEYTWDFGDGSDPQSSQSSTTTYGYTSQGTYQTKLTVRDDCNATAEATVEVTIVGPTPPADDDGSDDDDPATPTPNDSSTAATLGFCYRVQRGDTLSGIGSFYGVPLFDLARVNNVWPEYFVLAGESLFVPIEPVKEGPNGYRVESGDTFYSIAYQCDLSVSYLAQVNNSNADATLTPGQIVILPLNR